MSRLLLVYEQNMPTVSGLVEQYSHLAQLHNDLIVGSKTISNLCPEDVCCNDVILFIRPDDVLSAAAARKARLAGRTVISFFDDDLFSYEPMAPWRRKAMYDTLANSHVIMSSSRHICEKYEKLTFGNRQSVIDTMVRREQIIEREKKKDGEKVKFVYAANPSHAKLFNMYVKPVLNEFLKCFGNRITFTFVGVHPDMSEFDGLVDIKFVNGMPLQEYRDYMAAGHFDVGIAPLEDTGFTHCKYFNKYIEYSMVGVAGVYSSIIPYTYAIRDHDNGLLADNTYEGWFNALSELVSDLSLVDRIVESAQNDLRSVYTEESIFRRICDDIPEIISAPGETGKCGQLALSKAWYYLLRPLDWVYLSIYYLKKGGFVKKVRTHFKERNAYKRS